jgi:hypothetical protein
MKINFIKKTVMLVIIALTLVMSSAFMLPENKQTNKTTKHLCEGKAWWYSYYFNDRQSMIISNVYNNDCNHCDNEISTDFKKWLIMNDYHNKNMSTDIKNIHNISEKEVNEARTETIYNYKQKGYSVQYVNYTYTDK